MPDIHELRPILTISAALGCGLTRSASEGPPADCQDG